MWKCTRALLELRPSSPDWFRATVWPLVTSLWSPATPIHGGGAELHFCLSTGIFMCVTFSAPYIHDTIYTRIRSHSFATWIFKSSSSSTKICSCLPNTSNALRHEFIKVLEMFHGDFAPRPFDKADQFLQIFLWAVRFFLCCRYPVPARPEGAPLSRVQAAGKNTSSCHVSGAILRRRFITRPRGDAPGEEQSYLCNRHSETLL